MCTRTHVNLQEDQHCPLDYLCMFIKEKLPDRGRWNQTYAYQFLQLNKGNFKQSSCFRNWVKTKMAEITKCLSQTIAMGLWYWTTSIVISTPFFPLVMPRNRFWLLLCFFHLGDNEQVWRGMAGYNTLSKLRLLYKNIVHAFWSVFSPHQHLSLDEGMVPWLGNLFFRVYNPDKPKKYGIKAYILCDPVTDYCSRFKLYTGKSDLLSNSNGATYDLVMDMMWGYFGQGYIM